MIQRRLQLSSTMDYVPVLGLTVCAAAFLLLATVAAPMSALSYEAEMKGCIGTNRRMSKPASGEHHLRNLQDRYTNCTYVDGNLELTWLDDTTDFGFLQHIREVTGYVLISHVDANLTLPSLQIIRGRKLFKDDQYALFVAYSSMYRLEMPKLADILAGSVNMFKNYNLCHMRSINWDEIISGPNETFKYTYNFSIAERECPRCHASCAAGCWGEGAANCQRFSKTVCSPQCDRGRCFGPRPRECCHEFCAGGCTGPTQKDCLACRNFYDNGVCKQECPPMQKYNPTNYLWEHNPEGKYAYGATCVRNCPEHLLKDSGACVRTCPPTKTAVHGECVPCNGPCPKTCIGAGIVHSGNIDTYEGCTIIEGSLEILQHSFDGYQHFYTNDTFGPYYGPLHPNRLEVFRSVHEITGSLNIQSSNTEFRNLSYFRNLEVIGGRQLSDTHSLYIARTSLRFLGMSRLKRISSGSVVILENFDLCVQNINWERLKKSPDHRVVIARNRNASECAACSAECTKDGCWGDGPEQCLECARFEYNATCLSRCDSVPGLFRLSDRHCAACHEQCADRCSGPGAEHCKTCKHVRDGKFCVPQCPVTKYAANGTCLACDSTCVGCTGPLNTIGSEGCVTCEKAILGEEGVQQCLRKDDPCPEGYYHDVILTDDPPFSSLMGKAICRRCHPRCKRCTSYGFHEQACQKCAVYKRGEQCEDECPHDHYVDAELSECFACDAECRGCTGPGPGNCMQCRTLKIFNGDPLVNGTSFNCTASCPSDYPYKIYPVEEQSPYCSAEQTIVGFLEGNGDARFVLIGVLIGLSVIIVICAAIMFRYNQIVKSRKEVVKMTKIFCEDSEPLQPSNVAPNLTRLKIINEQELRRGAQLGMGAFGTVYEGLWIQDEKKKLPVAIKIPLDMSGPQASQDFREEAYIMASVDHPNLLSLLAVCMTSEMMFVTQLMPHGSLLNYMKTRKTRPGSKVLLNWSTQIARGMAYLEDRRLVHRDLAARNVLVKNDSLVKIADFGLAKLLSQDCDEYKAPGGKMPIKWLALECIRNRVFTSKSDVWAFGVTIWELLTFGDRPYGDTPARDVPGLIERGERLPQPDICTLDVYMTLLGSWNLDAGLRPSFKDLELVFSGYARDPGRYLCIQDDVHMRPALFTNHDARDLLQETTKSSSIPITDLSSIMVTVDGTGDEDCGRSGSVAAGFSASVSCGFERVSYRAGGSVAAGTDECDHKVRPKLANLKIPLDEDDYLIPSNLGSIASASLVGAYGAFGQDYMQVVKTPSCIDNPEYMGMSAATEFELQKRRQHFQQQPKSPISPMPTQTIGIPLMPPSHMDGAHVMTISSPNMFTDVRMSESSDHEYYNDLQKDIFPLHGETTV